jgi:predicted HAD superfamily Cof-like phosphohydrolase
MDKELEDVRAFHNKFGILDNGRVPTMVTKRKLRERLECMQEELDEFKNALDSQDFVEQADALIDLVYFAKGTAVMMGLPWTDLWDDVQRANMEKVRGVGKRGHAVDMIKPEGWQAPNGAKILKGAGWHRNNFTDELGRIDEGLCSDDAFRKVEAPKLMESDCASTNSDEATRAFMASKIEGDR